MAEGNKDYSLTLARVVLGGTALLHGIADTFGVWGGPRLGKTTADLAQHTDLSAEWWFYIVSIGLMLAGIVLLLGLMTRATALLIAFLAAWHGLANDRFQAYFVHAQGCETVLVVIALAVVVAVHGPGALVVDLGKAAKK